MHKKLVRWIKALVTLQSFALFALMILFHEKEGDSILGTVSVVHTEQGKCPDLAVLGYLQLFSSVFLCFLGFFSKNYIMFEKTQLNIAVTDNLFVLKFSQHTVRMVHWYPISLIKSLINTLKSRKCKFN